MVSDQTGIETRLPSRPVGEQPKLRLQKKIHITSVTMARKFWLLLYKLPHLMHDNRHRSSKSASLYKQTSLGHRVSGECTTKCDTETLTLRQKKSLCFVTAEVSVHI